MSETRIYRVADGDQIRLIEAASIAQAIKHCAEQRYTVTVAKPKDIAYLVGLGAKVERTNGAGE